MSAGRTLSINLPNSLTELAPLFDKLQRSLLNNLLNSGALAIKSGGSAIVKSVNTVYFTVGGQVFSKAAADMAALAGTVTNAKFNVFVFTVSSAGVLHTYMGTEAATLGGVAFPSITEGEVRIGFIIVNPTGTGAFVGGTTALDDATVVPNVVYINTPYPFHTGLLSL